MANDNISLDELLGGAPEVHELADADLEGVVGGAISPIAQSMLLTAIGTYRKDYTLEEALQKIPSLFESFQNDPMYASFVQGATIEEVTEFVKQNW